MSARQWPCGNLSKSEFAAKERRVKLPSGSVYGMSFNFHTTKAKLTWSSVDVRAF